MRALRRPRISEVLSIAAVILASAWVGYEIRAGNALFESLLTLLAAVGNQVFSQWKTPLKTDAGPSPHDKTLFGAFLKELPAYPTIEMLRDHDFGNSFPRSSLQPLLSFAESWNNVEHEFVDDVLETERRALFEQANRLAWLFAELTVPIGDMKLASVYSDSLRAEGGPRPQFVIDDAKKLNEAARDFVPAYDRFVRRCRQALSIPG